MQAIDWMLTAAIVVFVAGLVAHAYARRQTKRVLAQVDRMTEEAAASNRRYAEWTAAQAASPAGRVVPGPSEDYGHEAWARFWAPQPPPMPGPAPTVEEATSYATEVYAHHTDVVDAEEWSLDIETDTDQTTPEVHVPSMIVRIVAQDPVLVGNFISPQGRTVTLATGGGPMLGVALHGAQPGEPVDVQCSGATQVGIGAVTIGSTTYPADIAPPALLAIPLGTITDVEVAVDYPAFELEVTTHGDSGRRYVNGRRETVTVACLYTEALHELHAGSHVMLHGREMLVWDMTVQAGVGEAIRVVYRLRPADMAAPVAADWLEQITGGVRRRQTSTARTVAESFALAAEGGRETADALERMRLALLDFPTAFGTREPRRTAKPEPEPTLRPAGGRRFDMGDE